MNNGPSFNPSQYYRPNPNRAYRPKLNYTEDFYIYAVKFGSIAHGAAAPQQSILIQSDSAFEWECSTFTALNGAAPVTDELQVAIMIQLQDGGSGRLLFSDSVPISDIAGPGREPFYLPVSRIFQPKSQIIITANNADPAADFTNVQLNFIGRKLFEAGPGNFPY